MGNVFRVLRRDILRLFKAPAAMVVIAALLVLPSLYTWYNVRGFWDPYNNTGNMRVCVVNEDEGGSSELAGELNVGDEIVDALRENHRLGWDFQDLDTAMEDLRAGRCYAVLQIPRDFTADLLSIATGEVEQPDIMYYVNEKMGPVAPKIVDTGATTLDEMVNSMFVATVSEAVADAVDEAAGSAQTRMAAARSSASLKVSNAIADLNESASVIDGLSEDLGRIRDKAMAVKGDLGRVDETLALASDGLADLSDLASDAGVDVAALGAAGAPAMNEGIAHVSEAASEGRAALGEVASALEGVHADLETARGFVREIADTSDEKVLPALKELASQPGLDASLKEALDRAVEKLEAQSALAHDALDAFDALGSISEGVYEPAKEAASVLDAAAGDTLAAASAYADAVFGSALPTLSASLADVSRAASSASQAVAAERSTVAHASSVLDEAASTVALAREALGQTGSLIADLASELAGVRDDFLAIGASNAINGLFGEDGLDASKVADFMGSPTTIVTEELYDLNAYGSAMAPLFMNLTFWIGAFMLLVVLKQEVDSEGIRRLTLTQRYVGRFLLFAIMVTLQAIVCCAGLPFIGVQVRNLGALFFAAVVCALTYLSIIYALSVTLQHIGKGVCIVLVFAQIPGATGLYPIEMTSPFFQAVYPLMPFTYGINAMREAIFGFYGGHYAADLAALGAFFAVFMAAGILLRPLMSNVNRMVAHQIRMSGIFVGESVEVPQRRYRLSQIVRMLMDREEYRQALRVRYKRFERLYPRLIRATIVVGAGVPIVLAVAFSLTSMGKVVLLSVWLVWLLLVFVFLIVIESLRYSIERQMRLDDMSEDELRDIYRGRTGAKDADGPARANGGGA